MATERHYFPGNNTPLGFYSYYKYILGQREANKIICVKGGPGCGKSTFMKKIGKGFAEKGENVDILHCSADSSSLDGILLPDKKVAIVDGTSPHVTDPLTPGAVDKILNLGDFWNEEGILANKDEIIDMNEERSRWYRIAYNYLNAAQSVFWSLGEVYNRAIEYSEIYGTVANIARYEYGAYDISMKPGREKRFFASAINGEGCVNYLPSLLKDMKRVYIVSCPIGFMNTSFMNVVKEGALYRGFDVECFYCPLCPEEKPEHIIVRETGTAFVTANCYHDLEPWEIAGDTEGEEDSESGESGEACESGEPVEGGKGCSGGESGEDCPAGAKEIILLDVGDFMDRVVIEQSEELLEGLLEEFDILLNRSYGAFSKAKELHRLVESLYIPNMNFTQINRLCDRTMDEMSL